MTFRFILQPSMAAIAAILTAARTRGPAALRISGPCCATRMSVSGGCGRD